MARVKHDSPGDVNEVVSTRRGLDDFDHRKRFSMVFIDRTCVSHRRVLDIVAGVIFTALALGIATPAWAQAQPTPSPGETCTPGLVVDFCSDVPPAQGFLFDNGVYTTIDAPDASTTIPFGINNRGQIIGVFRVPGDIQ
jgi:hypothetical protein